MVIIIFIQNVSPFLIFPPLLISYADQLALISAFHIGKTRVIYPIDAIAYLLGNELNDGRNDAAKRLSGDEKAEFLTKTECYGRTARIRKTYYSTNVIVKVRFAYSKSIIAFGFV